MSQETIYWYDFETTGTDPALDRAVQFAGVRTDTELNVISEPQNLHCLPGDDVVPHPEAIAVTGIGYKILQDKGLIERDFIQQIHDQFAAPNTCVSGYNSIRFDDEFTRNLLYRNFHDAYQREWQNGNSRWDVMDLFRMAYALRPDGFNWPVNDEGKVSFRLELLTAANGISHESAHDAVSDVLATIEVTKLLRKAQPKLYDYMYGLRRKQAVLRQLYPLGKTPVVHISGMYPVAQHCLGIILPICVHPTNSNGVICFDLNQDPSRLIEMGPEALRQQIFKATADLEPGETRIAIKTIHINKCPAVAPISTIRGQEQRLGLDMDLCYQNLEKIQQAAGVVEKLSEIFSKTSFEAKDDPDQMLYAGGFFTDSDKTVMSDVRQAAPDQLMTFEGKFQDDRLAEMLFRYKARNFPSALTEPEQGRWDQFRKARFVGEDAPSARLKRFETILGNVPPSRSEVNSALLEWCDYLKQLNLLER